MKKISQLVLVLLFVSFVVPSIAMASWWNPFSWFHNDISKQDKTLELEKQIQELQAKLASTTNPQTSGEIATTTKAINAGSVVLNPNVSIITKPTVNLSVPDSMIQNSDSEPVITNDQKCQNSYGSNSVFSGKKDKTGGIICDCNASSYWNQDQTKCESYSGPPRLFKDGELSLGSYNGLNVLDYVKNPKASLDKPVMIMNGIIIAFNQGSSNYIEVVDGDDLSSSPKSIEFRVESNNEYTIITNELAKWDKVMIYGYGANNVKFNIVGNGGSYESYEPSIDVDAVFKCNSSSPCQSKFNHGLTKIFEKKYK